MGKVAGLQAVAIDGVNYKVSERVTYRIGGVNREEAVNHDGSIDYMEQAVAGTIDFTIRDDGKINLSDFVNMSGVTVVCDLANGKQVIGQNVTLKEVPSVNTSDGTFPVSFFGQIVFEA